MADHIAMSITMPEFVRSGVRMAALLALGASVAACGSFNDASRKFADSITPYKVEVVQGNVITKEQVDALQKPWWLSCCWSALVRLRILSVTATAGSRTA